MIQILDNDLPVNVANKLITGTKPYNPTPFMRALGTAITGNEKSSETQDMFSIEEIKEIAEYLEVYCKTHKNGD